MIFFCGMLDHISMSGAQRLAALREEGHHVVPFHQDQHMAHAMRTWPLRKWTDCVFRPEAVTAFNAAFLTALRRSAPSIAWIEKALLLQPSTLERARDLLPNCTFVCFQDDDPFGLRLEEERLWRSFIAAIPFYDVHFVKRKDNIAEFAAHGARHVAIFTSGFHAPLFHPAPVTSSSKQHEVVFVGTALDHRTAHVASLLRDHSLPLAVFGNRWRRHMVFYRYRSHFHPAVWGASYAHVLRSACIALGYVSSSNRDEYSMRSFEIPAVGTFLLAERTAAHMAFFEEGREAEFFSSPRECATKARFFLTHSSDRERMALSAYRRSVDSDYTLRRRMRDALSSLSSLR